MEDKNKLNESARNLANCILDSDKDYLDNVISIWSVARKIYSDAWNTEFHVFGVISSDTDHLPIKRTRELCSKEWLQKCDSELAGVIEFYKQDVTEACNAILLKYKSV